jgi:hypothetical protein
MKPIRTSGFRNGGTLITENAYSQKNEKKSAENKNMKDREGNFLVEVVTSVRGSRFFFRATSYYSVRPPSEVADYLSCHEAH